MVVGANLVVARGPTPEGFGPQGGPEGRPYNAMAGATYITNH
jgi:hypothetical protein